MTMLTRSLCLFFVQLIRSPSSLLRANWPIPPCLYHSSPSAADLLYLNFWHLCSDVVETNKKKNIRVGCIIWDSNPWDFCFLISLWTHRCEIAEINFGQDNRLLRLQENPASVPLTVFFILSCFYNSFIIHPLVGTQNIPSGIYMQSYKLSSSQRKKKVVFWQCYSENLSNFCIGIEHICIFTVVCGCIFVLTNEISYLFRRKLSFFLKALLNVSQ